jgi:hypothetical protein
MQSVTISVYTLTRMLDEMSADHGDIEVDKIIISSIIDGWLNGKHVDSLEDLSKYLRSKATLVDATIQKITESKQ